MLKAFQNLFLFYEEKEFLRKKSVMRRHVVRGVTII